MQEIVKAGQRSAAGEYGSLDEAKAELADEPYKLELVDIKGDVDDAEVDGGRRRRADHLRQPRHRTASGSGATCAAGRTCRPPGSSRRSS